MWITLALFCGLWSMIPPGSEQVMVIVLAGIFQIVEDTDSDADALCIPIAIDRWSDVPAGVLGIYQSCLGVF